MKSKILLVALFLSGCNQPAYISNETLFDDMHLTPSEKSMIVAWKNRVNQSSCNTNKLLSLYDGLQYVLSARLDVPKTFEPFCDIKKDIQVIDQNVKDNLTTNCSGLTLSEFYYKAQGVSLDQCDGPRTFSTASKSDIIADNVQNYELSTSMYTDLIASVKDCRRANTQVQGKFEPYQKLTKEDYDWVVRVIQDCNKFRLEEALNK